MIFRFFDFIISQNDLDSYFENLAFFLLRMALKKCRQADSVFCATKKQTSPSACLPFSVFHSLYSQSPLYSGKHAEYI